MTDRIVVVTLHRRSYIVFVSDDPDDARDAYGYWTAQVARSGASAVVELREDGRTLDAAEYADGHRVLGAVE